jgi:hypothetical protein
VVLARIETAAGWCPHGGGRKLEAHEQEVVIGSDEDGSGGLADPELIHGDAVSRPACRG